MVNSTIQKLVYRMGHATYQISANVNTLASLARPYAIYATYPLSGSTHQAKDWLENQC